MAISAAMNMEILRFGYRKYREGIPIAIVSEALEIEAIGKLGGKNTEDSFYLHLDQLQKAGFVYLHDIGRIDINNAGIPTVHIGRDPGYQLTHAGVEYARDILSLEE